LVPTLLTAPSFAQGSSKVFGCQRYGADVVHCDLMLGEMDGYEVTGNSTVVHPLSSGETLFTSGKFGGAAELRAEYRQSIEIMNTPEMNPEEFTVAFWLKQGLPQPYSHVVSHSNKAQTAGWLFDIFAAGNQQSAPASSLRFGVLNSNGTLFAPAEIPLSGSEEFVHVAGTFDGSSLHIFKDGAEAGTASFDGNYTVDPGVPIRIGSAAYCSSCNRWAGAIDDVQIYDRALEQNELSQIFETGQSSEGLIGHWKFDNDTSDVLGNHEGTSTTLITSMAFAPDGRLFISEKNTGEIRIMSSDFALEEEPFARVDNVYASWEQGMLGLAVDPDFEQNGFVYLYYTALVDTQNGNGGKVVNRLVRFTDADSKGTDMTVLMDNIPASRGFHSGGALAFGPDGKLYFTVGDATEHVFAQDPSITVGKILRINKDGSIPADNPFSGSPVYTIGHRNMYGIAFDSDGTGMITENGDFHYDELNVIIKGENYGFPTHQPPNLPPEMANGTSIKPVRSYWDAIAPTQMIYYTGDAMPELAGMFVFGSFTGDLYAVKLADNKTRIEVEQKIELAHFPFVPTVALAQSPSGEIYYGGYQIYRLNSVSDMTQNVYQVTVDTPESVDIADLQLDLENNKLVMDISRGEQTDSDTTLKVKIPNGLLSNITAVTLESTTAGPEGKSLDFTLDDSDSENTVVEFATEGSADSTIQIAIIGSRVLPEFPASSAITAMSVILAIASSVLLARKMR
jgi:glucose/arabinose dehydrogenase